MPRWQEWRIDTAGGLATIKVFHSRWSSVWFDQLAGAKDWELVVRTRRGEPTMVYIVRPGYSWEDSVLASREMPDTPEELLHWYRMAVAMHGEEK